jgi:acyl-CoA thioesterase I
MRTLPPRPMPANMVTRLVLYNCLWTVIALLLAVGAATVTGAQAPGQAPLRLVVLGDSLVAGFQLKASDAFPAQLERALKARGYQVEVINAGVSGDTTAAGLERLQWSVPDGTDAVIVELGANDALLGLDPAKAKANLDKIVTAVKAAGAEVLLAGMLAPRNLGEDYARAFDGIYPGLAGKHGVLLYPFFLDGVVLDPKLNLSDGMHPNPKGVAEIVGRILPAVEDLIARVRARRTAGASGG